MLGKMYQDGIALPRNDVAAHKWLDISERWTPNASGWSIETPDGPVPLADEIRTLAEGMTPKQVAEAQRAADARSSTPTGNSDRRPLCCTPICRVTCPRPAPMLPS